MAQDQHINKLTADDSTEAQNTPPTEAVSLKKSPASPTTITPYIYSGWVAPLSPDAFYGLAGKITTTIIPHTESDPAAILLQLLTGFGNVIGHKPHFMVEYTRHHTNLFTVIVGQTAKARKGTSWGQVNRLLTEADPEWSDHCVHQASPTGEGLMWALRDPV